LLKTLFRRMQNRADDLTEATLVLHPDDEGISFQYRELFRTVPLKKSIRLQFLAAQADNEWRAAEIRVRADVPDGADGDFGARSVHGNAAAVGVGDGDYIINIGEAWKDFVLDAPHRVVHCRRDALHGSRNAEEVFGGNASVRIAKAVEGIAGERRLRSRHCV